MTWLEFVLEKSLQVLIFYQLCNYFLPGTTFLKSTAAVENLKWFKKGMISVLKCVE